MKQGIIFAFLFSALAASGAPISVGAPKVENQINPTGVSSTPRLSWHLVSDERSKHQTAYQILAASSEALLTEEKADLWNVGFTKGGQRMLIPWAGKKLKDGQTVFWKIRVKDETETIGEWTAPAQFTVGGKIGLKNPARTSGFESSSPVLNKLYEDSLSELQTRIEKFSAGDVPALGTGAEVQRAAREYLYHFDATPQLMEWLRLMDAKQTEEGFFPTYPGSATFGSVSSDAGITVTYPVWWMSGDSEFVKGRWPVMEKYLQAREKVDMEFKGSRWGEGYEEKGTSPEYVDLVSLGFTNRLMRELASPAEEPLNSIRYKDYAARIRVSFAGQYLDQDGSLKPESQSAKLLALRSAVLPEDRKGAKIEKNQTLVLNNLYASLEKEGARVGPMGALFLPQVLALTSHQSDAVKILLNLSEEQRSTFMGSGTTEWMMSYLAGIDAASPGFQQVRIAPNIPADDSIKWVKAHYDSASGRVEVRWEKLENKGLKVDITVPAGILSRVFLPVQKGQKITESGIEIKESIGVELAQQSDSMAILLTQSGKYSFEIK